MTEKRKPDYAKKIKLPTQMTSKKQPRCPICRAPFSQRCVRCGYTLIKGKSFSMMFVDGNKVRFESKEATSSIL